MLRMASVGIRQAKTHLSELIRRVSTGEEIVILRGREPVARPVPSRAPERRRLGVDSGSFTVPDDLDEPLPADVLETFER
jgi:prevent-host-death family protein